MTDEERITQIEKDRRRRERELLALLILFSLHSEEAGLAAIRAGNNPAVAIRGVWLGSASQGYPGMIDVMAEQMALSNAAGTIRASRLTNIEVPTPDVQAITGGYADASRDAVTQTVETLVDKVQKALADAGNPTEALSEAYKSGGYLVENPSTLEVGATKVVVDTYGAGMRVVYDGMEGDLLRHHSVIDAATTRICLVRDGLTLPANSEYWLTNWPSLHFSCRSVVLPAPQGSVVSSTLPSVPPAPGFGFVASPDYLNV